MPSASAAPHADRYGFPLELKASERQAYAACEATAVRRAARDWQAGAATGTSTSTFRRPFQKNLKTRCRKVRLPCMGPPTQAANAGRDTSLCKCSRVVTGAPPQLCKWMEAGLSSLMQRRNLQGVPPALRGEVWLQISGAAARQAAAQRGYFDACVQRLSAQHDSAHLKQIKLDVPRTFPEHPYFKEAAGQAALHSVLTAFAAHNPAIGYCQSMNFVAGLLLLVLRREPEDAFWALTVLIEGAPSLRSLRRFTALLCHLMGHEFKADVCRGPEGRGVVQTR